MITKDISKDLVLNLDRKATIISIVFIEEAIILGVKIDHYKNGELFTSSSVTSYTRSLSTVGNFVNPTTGVKVEKDVNGNYPEGSIPEITFLYNIPSEFSEAPTIWGKIEDILEAKLTQLDTNNRLN